MISGYSQLTTNELTSEDTNWFSPNETKFHNCHSDSNSNNIHSGVIYSVKVGGVNNTSGEITKIKTCATEASLTSGTESELILVADYKIPLSEVIAMSTTADDNNRNINTKTTDDKIPTAEKRSNGTSLIKIADNGFAPVADHNRPLSEVVVISSATEPVSDG